MSEEIIQNQIITEKILSVDLPKVQLKQLIEALIMGSDEVVTAKDIRIVFDEVNKIASQQTLQNKYETISSEELNKIVDELNREYENSKRPFKIQKIAGGFLFVTHPEYSIWLGKLYNERARKKLSTTAIETLAIIAYRQPISKTEIEFIRGVNCDYILKTLLEKNIVSIVGRSPSPGRPLLYGTTSEFLKQFGLNDISELPKPREIEDMMTEAEREMEKHILRDEQNELSFEEKKIEPVDINSRAPHIPRKKSILQMTSDEIAKLKMERRKDIPDSEKIEPVAIEDTDEKAVNIMDYVDKAKIQTPKIKIEKIEEPKQEEILIETTTNLNTENKIETEAEQKGWQKWKNRITKAIKNLFG